MILLYNFVCVASIAFGNAAYGQAWLDGNNVDFLRPHFDVDNQYGNIDNVIATTEDEDYMFVIDESYRSNTRTGDPVSERLNVIDIFSAEEVSDSEIGEKKKIKKEGSPFGYNTSFSDEALCKDWAQYRAKKRGNDYQSTIRSSLYHDPLACWIWNLKVNIPDETFRDGAFAVVSRQYSSRSAHKATYLSFLFLMPALTVGVPCSILFNSC